MKHLIAVPHQMRMKKTYVKVYLVTAILSALPWQSLVDGGVETLADIAVSVETFLLVIWPLLIIKSDSPTSFCLFNSEQRLL